MAQHATRSRTPIAVLLRCLLALALIAPAAALFAQVWTTVTGGAGTARQERQGIEYLTSLDRLTIALTDAQSAAVAGRPLPRDELTRAVEATGAVDARIGGGLRTHERWTGLRAGIEALASAASPAADPYSAYGETTDMLLALYAEVRKNSQLAREQDADAYYLQDGAAEQLPAAVVAAGRFADLAVMAGTRPRGDAATTAAGLLTARNTVIAPANVLAADLQAAVDGTSSRTLGANLLSRMDRFRRSMETLTATAVPVDGRTPVDIVVLQNIRTEIQSAALDLAATILGELDQLVGARIGDLDGQRRTAAATMAAAVLLALLPAAALFVRPRRRPAAEPAVPPPAVAVPPGHETGPAARHREPAGAR